MGWEDGTPVAAPPAPAAPPLEPWQTGLPVQESANVPRAATGAMESIQAGWQGSAPGLAWRGKLPDLVQDPAHSKWWERALTGVTQVGAELPLMIAGSAAGAPVGAAIGTAVGGPVGTAIGGPLGAGAGMFAVPAAIRETLIQAYKSGDIATGSDFWNALRTVATTTAKEGAIGAATFGAGGLAARAAGTAMVPAIGSAISVPTAIKAIGAADVSAQIAAMTAIPAALQGRLPDAQEFMDAAIVVGGLKAAHSIAGRLADVYAKTGRTPAEQAADAQADPSIAADLVRADNAERTGTDSGVPYKLDRLIAEAQLLGRGGVQEANARTMMRDAAEAGKLLPQQNATALDTTLARAEMDWQIPWAPDVKALIKDIKAQGPLQGSLLEDVGRLERIANEVGGRAETVVNPDTRQAEIVTTPPRPLTDQERAELADLRTKIASGLHEQDVSREAGLQSIYDDVFQKMTAARRPADEATAIATLERERYRARGARAGEDPAAMYFKRPVQIRGEEPPAPEEAGWTKAKPGPGFPGIKPPDTYERTDDIGTRTMKMRENRVQSDRSVGDYTVTDSYGKPVDVRVTKDHVTGKTIASTGFDDNRDITTLLDSGVPLLDALQRTFSTREAPPPTKKAIGAPVPTNLRGMEDPEIRDQVKSIAYDEAGWITMGGKLDVARMVEEHGPGILDEYGRPTKLGVVAFTKWIPKAEWWADRPDKTMNEAKYKKAVDKAIAGEKLSPAEQRAIDYLVEIANKRTAVVEALGPDEFAATAADVMDMDSGPTTQNIADADAVARVAAFDEAIVERLATEHGTDDDAFMKAIREVLNDITAEEERKSRSAAGAGGEADTGAAPGENGDHPLKYEQRKSDVAPIWYSELARKLDEAKMEQAPAKGWKDYIRGLAQKGVKPDEVKWSGIEDWLDAQDGKVTKADVLAFLEQGGVRVQEVMLGGDGTPSLSDPRIAPDVATLRASGWAIEQNPEDAQRIAFVDPDSEDFVSAHEIRQYAAEDPALEPLAAAAENIEAHWYEYGNEQQQTRYSNYVLPGGENYRELLLTLPAKPAVDRNTLLPAGYHIEEMQGGSWTLVTPDGSGKVLAYLTPNTPRWAATEEAIRVLRHEGVISAEAPAFHSSHFDQENIATHIRFTDRVTGKTDLADIERRLMEAVGASKASSLASGAPDVAIRKGLITPEEAADWSTARGMQNDYKDKPGTGSKVLFVEEIQSDWAQKGKKEGFAGERTGQYYREIGYTAEPVARDTMEVRNQVGAAVYTAHGVASEGDALEAFAKTKQGDVPTAPFVGKTDSWTALALKRMIRYAAENGYDKIAWTRGEQQVERYTSALRKAVDVVEWEKTKDGIHLVGYKGGGLTETQRETLAALEDAEQHAAARGAVLDDAAQSALDALRRPARRAPAKKVVDTTEKETALSDAIGKSMADRIISDPAQSGTIEGDGIKIDDTGMAGFYDRIVPKVANEVLKKLGGGKVQNFDIRTGKPGYIDETDVEWPTGNETDINKQPGFDITPELRERAMKGMPLFQDKKPGQEAIAGSDDLRGAYTPGENLVELFRASDRSTALHELGHSWLEELKADAALPNASEQLKADWEIARRELAIPASGEIGVASHEQWARSVERYVSEGRAPSTELAGLFARFREWLLTLWKQIRERPVEVSPDLRQVLDRMLATDQQIQEAQDLGVPRAYVDVAKAETARKIIPGDVAKQAAQKPFADELPPGPGEAPDKIHVNYKYINSPTDLKLAMQRLAELDQAEIQKQRGGVEGVKSWAMANAEQQKYLNDVLGGSEDTLHLFAARDPNAPQIDVRLGVMKKLVTGAAREADRLRDIVLEHAYDATVQEQLEYMGALERLRMLQAEFLGERAGVARALNALKDTTEGSGEISRMLEVIGVGDTRLFQRTPAEQNAYLKAKLDEIMLNYKGKSVLDIARLHKEIGTLKGTFKLAKEAAKATTRQKLIEGWKSALLSGPVTHVTNLFGTGAFQVMRPVVDTVAAGIGIMRGARPGERLMAAEGVARLTGYLGGIQDATKVAFHTFMMDQTTGKTESYRNAIEGRKGDIIRIPLRAMAAEDAFVNTMYTRSELRTLAMRQAFAEGRNPRTREYAERVDQLVDNPPPDMKAKADLEATRMTFNADLGEKGRALQLFVNKWNLQWMIPFIRTPINIAKEMARISPFAPLVGEWRAAIRAGGIERDRALAEVAIGSGLMTLAAAWSFAGNLSGAGSPDPGKNRAKVGVWQPYSILVGDTWYEYDRIQPVGTLVGFAADMANVWDHMTPEEMDKIPKMLAVAFSNAVTNQTFLQGITNVINAMSDPTRFAPQFARQLASTAVPNIIGQPTAMADPVVREVNSMLEAIQARIPGAREQLLSKKDWLGEPVETKERLGVISPIRQTSISEDKVRQEAARLDIAVAAAPKKMHIGKGSGKLGDVELTPEERDKFETSGGQMAHGILSNIVNSAGYDQIPDLIKRNIFSNVLAASHRFAAAMALPMDKKMAYIQQITERMTAELQPQQE